MSIALQQETATHASQSAAEGETALAATGYAPGPVLLLGAPGAGKGTQAKQLMAAWHVPQISTGDILRGNVARQTELGIAAKGLMDRGELVGDDLVNSMVADRLAQQDCERGYILDGYPRTLQQARWLDEHFAANPAHFEQESESTQPMLPLIAVNIRISYTSLMRRITGRRTCPVCQRIYNIHMQPPVHDGVCDVEGATLVQRADDKEEVVAERMKAYESLTAPVIDHYRAQGRFAEVDGEQPVDKVFAEVIAQLTQLRRSCGKAGAGGVR